MGFLFSPVAAHELPGSRKTPICPPIKNIRDNFAADLDAAGSAVETAPTIGDRKKGDLAALCVYEFRSQGQLYLLGYTIGEELKLVCLEAVGPHENFYRDLK